MIKMYLDYNEVQKTLLPLQVTERWLTANEIAFLSGISQPKTVVHLRRLRELEKVEMSEGAGIKKYFYIYPPLYIKSDIE